MNESISIFIIAFTVVNVAGCVWLMWWSARHRQGSGEHSQAHVWDGDLTEMNNPLPRWWLGLFIGTIIFGVIYLIVYPGLGNFAGTQRWSQISQHEAEARKAQSQLERHLVGLEKKSIQELSRDPAAMATAKNLFGLHCSTCHGSDARGARGFPNLTDGDWLWSNDAESIYQTIAQGRQGVMPAWGTALGHQGVEEVTAYVVSLTGRKVPKDWADAGNARFAMMCAGCHGTGGVGNRLLGAPNLTDRTWLYGGTLETVRESIENGRNNQMPAHEDLIGPMKTKLMAAYVLSLSQTPTSAGQP